MRKHYIKTNADGIVIQTLVTAGELPEGHGMTEVVNAADYVGKKIVNGQPVDIEG